MTTPFLFQSEVTLFFDDDYFRTFLPASEKSRTEYDGGWVEVEPADAAAIAGIVPETPEGLAFHGGNVLREYDSAWGRDSERFTWVWAFERR